MIGYLTSVLFQNPVIVISIKCLEINNWRREDLIQSPSHSVKIQIIAFTHQANFPAHNLNFHWRWRWWDQIQATF